MWTFLEGLDRSCLRAFVEAWWSVEYLVSSRFKNVCSKMKVIMKSNRFYVFVLAAYFVSLAKTPPLLPSPPLRLRPPRSFNTLKALGEAVMTWQRCFNHHHMYFERNSRVFAGPSIGYTSSVLSVRIRPVSSTVDT